MHLAISLDFFFIFLRNVTTPLHAYVSSFPLPYYIHMWTCMHALPESKYEIYIWQLRNVAKSNELKKCVCRIFQSPYTYMHACCRHYIHDISFRCIEHFHLIAVHNIPFIYY